MKVLTQVLFAFIIIVGLISLQMRSSAGIANTLAAVVVQLTGGTIFAVGLLGEGIIPISNWINRYLLFSKNPSITLAPLIILLNMLSMSLPPSLKARELLNFVGNGVTLILLVTLLGQSGKLGFLSMPHYSGLVRLLLIFLGVSIYWIGLRYMGN